MTSNRAVFNFWMMLLLLLCTESFAQKSTGGARKCQCGFGTINQAGVFVAGDRLPAGQLQSVNGLRYKQWFAGIGVGIDFYRYRSVPVFLDVRRTIFNKATTPFVYADFGVNYPWIRSTEKTYYRPTDFRTGYYFDFGAGYKFHLANKHNIVLSAGYTEKKTREDKPVPDYGCGNLPCPDNVDVYRYTMKRIIVRVGWALW